MSDYISRRAAIEAINIHFGFDIEGEYGSAVQEVINSLPSVQPEIIYCKDCKQFRRWIDTDICFCDITEVEMSDNDFCSKAERREATT